MGKRISAREEKSLLLRTLQCRRQENERNSLQFKFYSEINIIIKLYEFVNYVCIK